MEASDVIDHVMNESMDLVIACLMNESMDLVYSMLDE